MKQTKSPIPAAALALMLAFAPGCKKVNTELVFRLTPYVQTEEDGPEAIAEGVIAYAFAADTADWAVASYADAEAGILTARRREGERQADVKTEQNEEGVLEIGPLRNDPTILVVCDVPNRIYAWRQVEIPANLPQLIVRMRFRPWRTDSLYKEANWFMVNETPPAPPEEPEQPGEGDGSGTEGNPQPSSGGFRARNDFR